MPRNFKAKASSVKEGKAQRLGNDVRQDFDAFAVRGCFQARRFHAVLYRSSRKKVEE